jgi:hypothetical protein
MKAEEMILPPGLVNACLEAETTLDGLLAWADSLAELDELAAVLADLDVSGLESDWIDVMHATVWEERIEPLRRIVGALGLEAAGRYLDSDGPSVLDDLRKGQRGWEYGVTVKVERLLRETDWSYARIGRMYDIPQSSVRDLARSLRARGDFSE